MSAATEGPKSGGESGGESGSESGGKPSPGSGWPVGIAVGLGAVGVANAIMITIALSNPPVPAARDHWQASLEWESELERRSRSAELGWRLEALERGAEGLRLRLVNAEGSPLIGLEGTLRVERADSARFDAELELRELGQGRYLAAIDDALAGTVRLRLSAHDPESETPREFIARRVVTLPRAAPVEATAPGDAGRGGARP